MTHGFTPLREGEMSPHDINRGLFVEVVKNLRTGDAIFFQKIISALRNVSLIHLMDMLREEVGISLQ